MKTYKVSGEVEDESKKEKGGRKGERKEEHFSKQDEEREVLKLDKVPSFQHGKKKRLSRLPGRSRKYNCCHGFSTNECGRV